MLNSQIYPSIINIFLLVLPIITAMNFEPAHCTDSNKTVYLRTEAVLIEDPPAATLVDLSLNECAKKCTKNIDGINCRSFEYNSDKESCSLKESNGQPFGRSILSAANRPGVAFFQKICIPSEELCSAPYTFDRYPQIVLSGHAMEVLATDNLSSCLLECLESRKRLMMDCRSVMYFYESGQCILNREHQKSAHSNMFSNETHFHLVDYFENNCFDINCFGDSQLHWVATQNFRIDSRKDVVLNGLSSEQCKQACVDNQVGIEVFPCKSYVFSSVKQECQLSAESGIQYDNQSISVSTALNNIPPTEIHGPDNSLLGDGGTTSASLKQNIGTELRDFSAGQYFEKICLSGSMKCSEGSFELTPNRMLNSSEKVIPTTSLNYCLQQCLLLAENCSSAMFFKEKDECVLNKKSQFSHPELFHPVQMVDYYDNVCDFLPGTKPSPSTLKDQEKAAILPAIEDPQMERPHHRTAKKVPRQKPEFTPHKHKSLSKTLNTKEVVETECRLSGIQILVHFSQPSSGALFVRDHSASCATNFETAFEAILEIPVPSSTDSNPNCAGVELAPNYWQFLVVLQKNNLGITSLMTGSDRVFNVTCDFSNLLLSAQSDKDQAINALSNNASNNLAGGAGKDNLEDAESLNKTVHMALLRQGKPVTTVSLGEELELRWTFSSNPVKHTITNRNQKKMTRKDTTTSPEYGFFVESCTAERLDGLAPDPPPLPLVTKGCPDARIREQLMRDPITKTFDGFNTSVKVFRFDGSRRVRIRCSVNICIEECRPDVDDYKLSYGRRRRRQTIGELAELVEKYDKVRNEVLRNKLSNGDTIQQSTITGSYTIMDGAVEPPTDQQLEERRSNLIPHSDSKKASPNSIDKNAGNKTHTSRTTKEEYLTGNTCGDFSEDANHVFIKSSSICLQRGVFIALIVAVACLSTVQTFHLLRAICNKCVEDEREEEEDNSSLYRQNATSNSSTFSPGCYRTYLHSPNFHSNRPQIAGEGVLGSKQNYAFDEGNECKIKTAQLSANPLLDLSRCKEAGRISSGDMKTKKREQTSDSGSVLFDTQVKAVENTLSTNFPVIKEHYSGRHKRDTQYPIHTDDVLRNDLIKLTGEKLYV